jgi:hypothetical protein
VSIGVRSFATPIAFVIAAILAIVVFFVIDNERVTHALSEAAEERTIGRERTTLGADAARSLRRCPSLSDSTTCFTVWPVHSYCGLRCVCAHYVRPVPEVSTCNRMRDGRWRSCSC